MTSPSPLLLLALLALFLAGGVPDLASDRTALLALRSVVAAYRLQWNTSQSPCFSGVRCRSNRVAVLRLPASASVAGFPTASPVTSLPFARSASSSTPSPAPSPMTSPMPPSSATYLQGNRFSGQILPAFFKLERIVRVSLTFNSSGKISPAFINLTRIATLSP